MDSHVVVRNSTVGSCVPFTQFPPLVKLWYWSLRFPRGSTSKDVKYTTHGSVHWHSHLRGLLSHSRQSLWQRLMLFCFLYPWARKRWSQRGNRRLDCVGPCEPFKPPQAIVISDNINNQHYKWVLIWGHTYRNNYIDFFSFTILTQWVTLINI